jgi:hypothetical protein
MEHPTDFGTVPDVDMAMLFEPGFIVDFGYCNLKAGKEVFDKFFKVAVSVQRSPVEQYASDIGVMVFVEFQTSLGRKWERVATFVIEEFQSFRSFRVNISEADQESIRETLWTFSSDSERIHSLCFQLGVSGLIELARVFQFLACKNVSIQERKNPVKKRSKGKDKRQVESYWVLDIPGSPRYWERSPSDGLSGIQHRLHVVRGHFRHYTEDRPHVSGWVGPMWISSHARGNAELGFADKDYSMSG